MKVAAQTYENDHSSVTLALWSCDVTHSLWETRQLGSQTAAAAAVQLTAALRQPAKMCSPPC